MNTIYYRLYAAIDGQDVIQGVVIQDIGEYLSIEGIFIITSRVIEDFITRVRVCVSNTIREENTEQ
ncbi:MAG: hypothetical protein IJ581_05545 [Paludibacteraceae bacterium]|nr:hypothetical protein [Paludibacteraceae bacterium]